MVGTIVNRISKETFADFLKAGGVINGQKRDYVIVDCRFDYEYAGGHIHNAINISDPELMGMTFFKDEAIE